MTRVLIASALDPAAIASLRRSHDVVCAVDADHAMLSSLIRDRQVLIFRSGVRITGDILSSAPDIKLLIRAGSGLDNVDLKSVRHLGIDLIRIPEPGARSVAELTFALILALARQILPADRLLRDGHWAKHELTGCLIGQKTLGIVGVGSIGSRVAEMGTSWGMRVIGCVEHPTPARALEFSRKGVRLANLEDVLAESDFVTLHVPLKPSTRNLVAAEQLSRMKPGAFLVNLARGGVVDEGALYDALTRERLAGAALDVHEREGEGHVSALAGLPNVVLTPHIGATTLDAQRQIGERVVELVAAFDRRSDGRRAAAATSDGD